VPRAENDPAINEPLSEGTPAMRASILEGMELAVDIEDSEVSAPDDELD
jgi:hypothetical protein